MLKWPYYPRQSMDSMQSLSNYHWHFSQNWNKNKMFNSMETQKILNRQNNLEKEEWSWRDQTPWLQTILQSYSSQNSVVLAPQQTPRSTDQKKSQRANLHNKGQLIYNKRSQEYTMEKKQSSISGAGKTGQLYVKEWNWNIF